MPVSIRLQIAERRIEQLASETGFVAVKYEHDARGFVHDCIELRGGETIAPYQDEILTEFPIRKRVAVRSPHGAGKTALAAWLVLWSVFTAPDVKTITTASVWRQLDKFLWPEIHKWWSRVRWDVLGIDKPDRALTVQQLSLSQTRLAFPVASNKPEFIEGAHAARMFYIIDEAKAVPDPTWDAIEGAFSTGDAYCFAISTPGEPVGRFYDIHRHKEGTQDWWAKHVTLAEAITAGRINQDWVEARRKQWGEKSPVFQNRVLGEFATQATDSVIPLAWIEAANVRWQEWHDLKEAQRGELVGLGEDVGDGEAETVAAPLWYVRNTQLKVIGELLIQESIAGETMQAVNLVYPKLYADDRRFCIVDSIGVGAGVFSRLKEVFGERIHSFRAGVSCPIMDASGEMGFADWRAYAWWNLRLLLNPERKDGALALPPDDQLTGDLTAPHWRVVAGNKIRVESKDELKKPTRLGRSTDRGDAVVQALVPPDLLDDAADLEGDFDFSNYRGV